MRIVVAVIVLAMFGSGASAGERCARLPLMVFYSQTADVHDDGTWHRTKHAHEQEGMLDAKALATFRAYVIAMRKPTEAARERTVQAGKMIACLDALIANPNSSAATKQCAPPKSST